MVVTSTVIGLLNAHQTFEDLGTSILLMLEVANLKVLKYFKASVA